MELQCRCDDGDRGDGGDKGDGGEMGGGGGGGKVTQTGAYYIIYY